MKKRMIDVIPGLNRSKPNETKTDYDPYAGEMLGLGLDAARADYIKKNIIQVKAPTPSSAQNTAMDSSCSNLNYDGQFTFVNRQVLSYFVASSSFIGYYAMAVVAQNKIVQMGCSSAAKDAMKNGYELVQEDGEELERKEKRQIAKLDKKYKLSQNIIEAETFNNVFGIRHVLFKHTDPNFDYSEPFNADSFKGGKYAGMAQIDPYWITPELNDKDITDPTAINYYEPTFWLIGGKRYHKSHFIVLKGDPVADYLKPTYRYGGISKAQQVYERVYAGERTANEIPQLVMTKRMNVRKTDLAKAQANKAKFIETLNAAAEFRDNYGTQVIGLGEESTQLETSLADLDDSMWANYHLVAAIFQRPVSKLFGTGHGGLGTGDTDEDYDIAMLETLQSGNLEDIAYAHYERLIMSEFNKEMELDIVWNPLKVMSDKDQAEVNFIKSQTDTNLYNTGAVGDVDIREKLSKDKLSGYSGVKVIIDVPHDDIKAMDESFKESDHPRNDIGEFSSGGGGGSKAASSPVEGKTKNNIDGGSIQSRLDEARKQGFNTESVFIHATNEADLSEIKGGGNFPGLFALRDEDAWQADNYGREKYQIVIKGEVWDNSKLESEVSGNYDKVVGMLHESAGGSWEGDISDVEDGLIDIINGDSLEQTDELTEFFGSFDEGDFFKDAQSLRMKIASNLGANAVTMEDEFGDDTVAILPGDGVMIVGKNE